MKKIYKIANMALIYTLIGVFLCSDVAYSSNLRPTHSYSRDAKDVNAERFEQLYNVLFKSKNVSKVNQNLNFIYKSISGDEQDAINFIKSFKGAQLLILLNRSLYNMKDKKNLEGIKRKVRKILSCLFGTPALWGALNGQLALHENIPDDRVALEFLDGESGQSAGFMYKKFPELLDILKDPQKTRDLVLLLSLFRVLYYSTTDSAYYEGKHKEDTPLEYAIKMDLYIPIGKNLYITPMSETFRRHILFRINSRGETTDAVEIFIIGDNRQQKRHLLRRERLDVCRDMYDSFGDECGIIKTHLMAEYPEGLMSQVEVYGDIFDFSEDTFRIFIYDYSDINHGRRLHKLSRAYVEKIAGGKDLSRLSSISETIIEDVLSIINRFIKRGYYFDRGEGTDLTILNFRLCKDGRTRAVGDFESFLKKAEVDKNRDLQNFERAPHLKNQLRRFILRRRIGIHPNAVDYDKIAGTVMTKAEVLKKRHGKSTTDKKLALGETLLREKRLKQLEGKIAAKKEVRLQEALKEIRTTRDSITKIIHNRNVRNITSKDAAGMPRFRILDIKSMLGALDLDTDLKEVKNLIKSMLKVNKSIEKLEQKSPDRPVERSDSTTLRAFNAAFKAIENLNLAIDGLAEFDIEELSILKKLSKTQQAVDKSI